jgi:YVTN family beta-propeller protein/parallel beta-helix repeat protein
MSKSFALIGTNGFEKSAKRIWRVSILLILIIVASLVSACLLVIGPVHAQVVINTTSVGGHQLNTLTYDSGKGEIFVSDQVNGISVISDSTNAVIATVTDTPTNCNGMAYDSGKNEIFVTSWETNNVSVISDDTNTVIANVAVGDKPLGVAYDSGKGEVFVANSVNDSVSVISDGTNSVVATVNVGSEPSGVAYDPVTGQIYVTNDDSNTVSVISDNTNTVVATITVVHEPYGLAFDSGKGEVFVASSASNLVSVISDKTNTVVASVTGATSLSLNGVAYDSKREEVFVTNFDYGTVSVISDNNTVVATVSVGNDPYGIAYDSSKGELFVTNYSAGTVSVISDSIPSTEFHYLGDITINADGTVSPPSAPIQKSSDTYILASDVDGSITVEKSNMIFNGNGHTVDGVLSIGSWGSGGNPPTQGLSFASNVTVENFTVTGSYYGIELIFMSNATVANNTITGTGNGILSLDEPTAGIDVEGGGSNVITGNDITHNYCGLSFLETIDNKIIGNDITDNHNTALGGGVGLMFWGASNNTVYHNNFIDNPEQAGEDSFNSASTGNVWDDGFPSGGNYWSDYQTRYPNATEIDNSGIGNTPYIIDSQNNDRYPLMKPSTTTPPQISLLSPTNMKYNESSVPLVFTVDRSVNWVGYSLDGLKNVTVTGNITLTGLSSSLHSVTVYANDTFGNMGASQTVNFTVALPHPFPTATVAAASGGSAVTVVVAGLLVYCKKRKGQA